MFYLIVTAEDKYMLSINNNDYDHIGRERQVIELYKQGKNTRYIAKELRMSLREGGRKQQPGSPIYNNPMPAKLAHTRLNEIA